MMPKHIPQSYRSSAQASEDVKHVSMKDRQEVYDTLGVAMDALWTASIQLNRIAPNDKRSKLVESQFLLEIVIEQLADVRGGVSMDGYDETARKRQEKNNARA